MRRILLPYDPDDDADEGDDEGEEGEGQAQQKAQRPAFTILAAAAAHNYLPS